MTADRTKKQAENLERLEKLTGMLILSVNDASAWETAAVILMDALEAALRQQNKYVDALKSIIARTEGGPGAAVCVTTNTLAAIAKQALQKQQ